VACSLHSNRYGIFNYLMERLNILLIAAVAQFGVRNLLFLFLASVSNDDNNLPDHLK